MEHDALRQGMAAPWCCALAAAGRETAREFYICQWPFALHSVSDQDYTTSVELEGTSTTVVNLNRGKAGPAAAGHVR
jgi:hypothetical protein